MRDLDGRANDGSEIGQARFYDGTGPSGHRAVEYVNCYIVFTNPINGLAYRTRGCMVERAEMRAVARALLEEADRLDSGSGG